MYVYKNEVLYLLDGLQGLCVFLLCLFDFCEAAAPDIDLCLLLERRTSEKVLNIIQWRKDFLLPAS